MARSAGNAGLIVLVFGIIGMIMAYIESVAYADGYLLNLYLTDASQLPGLMIITIILFLLMGGVVAAVTQS